MPIAAKGQIVVATDRDAEGPEISLEDADSTDMQQGSRDSSDNIAAGVAATFNA